MKHSVALPSFVQAEAARHLIRLDGQEDLCFALWNPSQGRDRLSALVQELILPEKGERRVHGNASFLPQYFERAIAAARSKNCGLAFMHSHPATGWQGMSQDDINAERGHAAAVLAATDLPFVGLTVGTDGAWSARFWPRVAPRTYERHWCESVRVVGERLTPTYNETALPSPRFREELTRTISAWGEAAQKDLARLRIGIVGAGSVGAIIGEAVARMGIRDVRLLDFDVVERVNLDRLLSATSDDADCKRLKVDALARRMRASATADEFAVEGIDASVVEEIGYRAALDCDILFSCVDRPWARFVLNAIAYAHLIPVVDGGIHLTAMASGKGLKRGTWRAHTAAPTRRCFECLGQYEPSDVSLERSGLLDDPTYIDGLPKDHALRRNENVFAFSLSVASLELEQFLRMTIPHPGHPNIGTQTFHFVAGQLESDHQGCGASCPFCAVVAKGDRAALSQITGFHHAAANARSRRRAIALARPTWWGRLRANLIAKLFRSRSHTSHI